MNRIRVLILSSEFPPGPGGIGNHACHLAKELTANNCEVIALAPQEFVTDEESDAFNREQVFRVFTLRQGGHALSKAVTRFRALKQQMRAFKPQVLIASGARSTWLAAAATMGRALPWIAIGHGSEFGNPESLEGNITRFAFNQADMTIFVSRFTRGIARQAGIPPRAEAVINNGADGRLFKPGGDGARERIAAQFGFSSADPLLLTVGNLTRRKGQEVVIAALPEVRQRFPDVRYLMAGLPTEKERLRQLAIELGVAENVYFLGNVDHASLLELYQACDLFLMTSQRLEDGDVEGFGISVIEAALCGKPAVVSGDSGLAEAVEEGVTGICVPEKDARATAEAIARLIGEPQLLTLMGKQALERARQHFTWESVGKTYSHEIAGLLEKKRRPALKLLIISHTPHYHSNGQIVGWGATIREIDQLARLFDEVVHIAPLHTEPDPGSSLPYQADNVRYQPVAPAGGESAIDKFSVLRQLPGYLRAFNEELRTADAVHVRCPAAISLSALIELTFRKTPGARWVKYAGNWQPRERDPLSYRFQRWMLRRNLPRGVVTVNGRWKNQPGHVRSFFNPCLSEEDLESAKSVTQDKNLASPCRLLFVGRLETAKGVGRVLETAGILLQRQVDFRLDLIGDGPERAAFEKQTSSLGLTDRVVFHGWLPKPALKEYYAASHFILLPSTASEGWPKVLSEAMAYGVVPLASAVSSIPQILSETGAGLAFNAHEPQAFADEIISMANHPSLWREYSRKAAQASSLFSYNQYLISVKTLFKDYWDIELKNE